jgi:hypothetical protein
MPDDNLAAALDEIRERDRMIWSDKDTRVSSSATADAARSAVPRLLAALGEVLKLHEAVPIYEIALHEGGTPRADGTMLCGHPVDAIDEGRHAVADDGPLICLDKLVYTACDDCRDEDGERVEWPCPTVQAINKALLGEGQQ